MKSSPSASALGLALALSFFLPGCGDDDGPAGPVDGGVEGDGAVDAGPAVPASTDHCDYAPLRPTAGAGGTVTAGPVSAGAAEAAVDVPVGATLGAYTSRGLFASGNRVDRRYMETAGAFNPSIGIETMPKVRAVALTAGDETLVLLKMDAGIPDEDLSHQVAEALGPSYAGKVVLVASHSHSAWANYTTNSAMQVGFGIFRTRVHERFLEALVAVAREALEGRVPARVGIAHDPDFDPEDRVNRDRRGENDELAGGRRDDHDLFVVRIDAADDGRPIAVLPVFGMHGTLQDADNQLAHTDAPGGIERAVEEAFDRTVVVMHLQGAGGDVSSAGSGGLQCDARPCLDFGRAETVGRYARDAIMTTWEAAGAAATDSVAMEVLTRAITLGPDWETFTIRDGALSYAPFDGRRIPDGTIFDGAGAVVSPIDEFNAPVGAALCGEDNLALVPGGQMPGTERLLPYRSCVTVDEAAALLGDALALPFEPMPVCASTRTVISAIRLGDFIIATLPGEPVTLLVDHLRSMSPVAPDKTIVLGYAQDNMGYLLTVEDWLSGGYEPSINFWGPLEGEYVAAQSAALMRLAATDEREDATAGAAHRWDPPAVPDELPEPDPAPMAGTIPDSVPDLVWVRGGEPLGAATRPPATLPRLGVARMAWIGEDPLAGTPRVTLQREQTPGAGDFVDVTRRSGRPVADQDLLLYHAPDPLVRAGTAPRTHYWVVEWQAVVPWGTDGLEALADRPGLPLGSYRLHVSGTGYTLDSDPIAVVPASLTVSASTEGGRLQVSVGYEATDGFRLLDLTERSNRRVPLREGPVAVVLTLANGSTHTVGDLSPALPGEVWVDVSSLPAAVVSVRVLDRFGNEGTAAP